MICMYGGLARFVRLPLFRNRSRGERPATMTTLDESLLCNLKTARRAAQVGGQNCTVLRQDGATGAISTVVLRASTDNLLDDLERAVDDGVNAYKVADPASSHP